MDLEILLILIVAFIFLGPQGMLEVATKLGELLRKSREILDQLKMEAYMQELNKKMLEEQEKEDLPDDISKELQEELEDIYEEEKEERVKDEKRERNSSGNASDGTSERAKV